jgi:integrase
MALTTTIPSSFRHWIRNRLDQKVYRARVKYTAGMHAIWMANGKGGRDRHVLSGPKLLETLRELLALDATEKTWLFPGMFNNWREDVPIGTKVVWEAVRVAKERAGITRERRRVSISL